MTSTSTWLSGLQTTVGGYTISNIQVLCGNTGAGAACTSANVSTLPAKYYSYTTSFTLSPIVQWLKPVLCSSPNANPCSFTLTYHRTLSMRIPMRNLLHCRRGSAAFATIIALMPLIGVVALGGEAGSWYVTKQHAQNAADAAAYSGALQLACIAGLRHRARIRKSVVYRGKEFAAQNAFCNAGDTSYPGSNVSTSLPTGMSRSPSRSIRSPHGTGSDGNFVQAIVSQHTAGLSGGSAWLVHCHHRRASRLPKCKAWRSPPCALALTGSISFQGSPNINAPNCGMASNDPANNALNFTGGGMSMNLGSLSAAGGCTGAASFCNTALTYMPPITNPFSALDGALTTLCGANPTNSPTRCGLSACPRIGALVAYTATNPCTNDGFTLKGNTPDPLAAGYTSFLAL